MSIPLRRFPVEAEQIYRFTAATLLLAFFLLGCAGPRTLLMEQVRSEISANEFQKAYSVYKTKVKQTERVDELLNLGLLAYEAGDYNGSFAALDKAEKLAEERKTQSLSREAAGVAISDRLRAYQGTIYDQAMLHYYRALGFLARNALESATVEGRRLGSYLEVNSRESKHSYKNDGFLQWFSGTLYDAYGQANDAWISYKQAHEAYGDFYGVSEPSFLCPATLAAVRKVGHEESEKELDERCPNSRALNPEYGRVVILCEAGTAPPILEDNLMIPILEDDPSWDDCDRDAYCEELAHRGHGYEYDRQRLKYLLRVAVPYYADGYTGTQVRHVVIRDSAGVEFTAELADNVSAILRKDLNDRYPAILARAISRAIIKYTATKLIEHEGKKKDKGLGEFLGLLTNIAGAATEAADTRSWETLPERIYAADFRLPPGSYSLRALFQDDLGGTVHRQEFPPFMLNTGDVVFLRARCVR